MNCRMKYKKVILTLLAIMLIGANSFVYAGEMEQQPIQTEASAEGLVELYHRAGLDSPQVIINTLANLGISNEELQGCIGQGKKIYDILQEREVTMVDFKKALTKEYKRTIKEATRNKVITKKEAKVLTNLLKEKMSTWDV